MICNKKYICIVTIIFLVFFVSAAVFAYQHRNGIICILKEKRDLMGECVPVLAYHGMVPSDIKAGDTFKDNKWIDDIEGFEKQMEYLKDNGWTTLSLDEFYQWHEGKLEIPEKSCLITFDDGYYEMYYTVYPILKKYDFNATCFIVGAYTPNVTFAYNPKQRASIGWDKVKEIQKEYPKLEFESHSYNLHGFDEAGNEPWVTASYEMLKDDFDKMDEYGFTYMAYPYGGYNDVMLDAIKTSNIKMAFTFKVSGYATKKYPVYEIPRQKITAETSFEQFRDILEKTL